VARPPLEAVLRVRATVWVHGVAREVVGELTVCPQLALTPLRGEAPGGTWLGVVLTHLPTGRYLPLQAWTDEVGVLHRVAELLAHLDWSCPDPACYARPAVAAARQACAEHDARTHGTRAPGGAS